MADHCGPDPPEPESQKGVPSAVSIILDSQPSCLEFTRSNDLLVVGTYNLVPGQATANNVDEEIAIADAIPLQKRTGSLLVYHITEQSASLLQTKVLPYAVLDLHFSPVDPSTFAIATSVGSVCLFSLDLNHGGGLSFIRSIQICDSSILVLGLTYRAPTQIERSPVIAVSLSNGHLAVFEEKQDERDIVTVPVHGYEAWTVAWSKAPIKAYKPRGILYSGGDDSALCQHDARFPLKVRDVDGEPVQDQSYRPLIRERRTHSAGITAIVPLGVYDCQGDEMLITGSFDDHVQIISPQDGGADIFAMRRVGGGVWRISNPFSFKETADGNSLSFKVLLSCMHAGPKVLEIRREGGELSGTWSTKVSAKFTEHKSMNYAGDVRKSKEGYTVVSTSFYDRKLCIWNLSGISDSSGDTQQSS